MSNPSLYRLLSASPFDLAPGESASERFNQHLRNQRRAATAAAHSTGRILSPSSRTTVPGGGGAAAAADTGPTAMQMPARSRICDQCGAIGGHTTACSATVVSLGDIPVVERWCGTTTTLFPLIFFLFFFFLLFFFFFFFFFFPFFYWLGRGFRSICLNVRTRAHVHAFTHTFEFFNILCLHTYSTGCVLLSIDTVV